MNLDSFIDLTRKGFRVSLGATYSLIETLQDPVQRDQSIAQLRLNLSQFPEIVQDAQKRQERLQSLQAELAQLSEIWEAKGEVTEREARNVVDMILAQYGQSQTSPSAGSMTVNAIATTVASPSIQQEIQELTAEISGLREDLEKLRKQGNSAA
jgi:polyhydroxyalkanoate synthesis regulator phasin